MTNTKVAEQWFLGKKAKTKHMSTDGVDLYSYGLQIGFTGKDGYKYVYNYTAHVDEDWLQNPVYPHFISMTTSQHVGIARGFGRAVPVRQYGSHI